MLFRSLPYRTEPDWEDNEYNEFYNHTIFFPANTDETSQDFPDFSNILNEVTIKPCAQVTGVTLNKTELSLTNGGREQLIATVSGTDLEDADRAVSWSSSNEAVATVDARGIVNAVGTGTAVITAASSVDGSISDACTVTVVEPSVPIEIGRAHV